jgi:uncharacterized SAM-binding protein YcdF (DUF218 family)
MPSSGTCPAATTNLRSSRFRSPRTRPGTGLCDKGQLAGVPIVCFHSEPLITRGETRYIATMAAQRDWHSVILVTSPDQALRARLRMSRCFDGKISVAHAGLHWYQFPWLVIYQWGATAKAYTLETSC